MDRRKFLRNGSLAGLGLSTVNLKTPKTPTGKTPVENIQKTPTGKTPKTPTGETRQTPTENIQQTPEIAGSAEFPLLETTIDELQQKMQAGEYTSQSITKLYLKRIAEIDRKGPTLNAVIEINPDALEIAERMDAERKAGRIRGPLHGIPVLIKDNIDSGDRMQTTAGALALEGHKAQKDAFIVSKLRESGAVLLGKTNLSEWANFRSTRSTSGWSSRGGQTRNPYLLNRDPSGSSAGSGSAVSANLCVVAVGTETNGSVVSPSSVNGIVGIKPTVGLLSRSGIIPISATQDTAGPMARTVRDAAILLGALAGIDPDDKITGESRGRGIPDYTAALNGNGLKGKTIGIEKTALSGHEAIVALLQDAAATLKARGATVVEVELQKLLSDANSGENAVLQYEFKDGIQRYLANTNAPVRSLREVIAFNIRNEKRAMPYFKQEVLERSDAKGGLDSPEYLDALKKLLTARTIIDNLFRQNGLDAICAPTTGPACCIDLVVGDYRTGFSFSGPAAIAGYPHITVPMGTVFGLPVGFSFMGLRYTEEPLIHMAYTYEQASKKRVTPAMVNASNF